MNDLQLSPAELETDDLEVCVYCDKPEDECDCPPEECDICMSFKCDPYNHMSDAEMYEHDQRDAFNDRLAMWRNEY